MWESLQVLSKVSNTGESPRQNPCECEPWGRPEDATAPCRHRGTHSGENPVGVSEVAKPTEISVPWKHSSSWRENSYVPCIYEQCSEAFSCLSSLQKLERNHAGEKPMNVKNVVKQLGIAESFKTMKEISLETNCLNANTGRAFWDPSSLQTQERTRWRGTLQT